MNIDVFATDEKLELEGIWKELGAGAAIKVARADNPKYKEKLDTIKRILSNLKQNEKNRCNSTSPAY